MIRFIYFKMFIYNNTHLLKKIWNWTKWKIYDKKCYLFCSKPWWWLSWIWPRTLWAATISTSFSLSVSLVPVSTAAKMLPALVTSSLCLGEILFVLTYTGAYLQAMCNLKAMKCSECICVGYRLCAKKKVKYRHYVLNQKIKCWLFTVLKQKF